MGVPQQQQKCQMHNDSQQRLPSQGLCGSRASQVLQVVLNRKGSESWQSEKKNLIGGSKKAKVSAREACVVSVAGSACEDWQPCHMS